MSLRGERLRYLPQRLPLSVQLAYQRDDFRNLLSGVGGYMLGERPLLFLPHHDSQLGGGESERGRRGRDVSA